MQELKFKIKNTEQAQVEIVPCADGVEIVIKYGESQKNYGSFNKEPHKFQRREDNSDKVIDSLREFCKNKIEEEPKWKDDIIKFGKFYSDRVKEGWKGEFRVNDLYRNWCDKRK